ncbi:MAG TPA: SpoIID/LytB domain-containing protein [Blastocatellia bacterium]|jgi:SpoIID/LytB domain protein|nr:SpoIID/LytB domain-containing protein [Blastocatellia bacterium]
MQIIDHEPFVSVGLMTGAESVVFELKSPFVIPVGERLDGGSYRATPVNNGVEIVSEEGWRGFSATEYFLTPAEPSATFIIRDVIIGIDFHWQRKQDQQFQGALRIKREPDGRLTVINEVPVESYLVGVISSEMSANAHPELLKAHSVISRSWLLAQMKPWKKERRKPSFAMRTIDGEKSLIRWYDQESHADFDVCADDHCQRYQGVAKATSATVYEAVNATFGQVLAFGEELCDARFSKSCGGMTESYDAAWEDSRFPYLAVSYDGEAFPAGFDLPLSDEANAERWIRNSPPAFCNTADTRILGKILPNFDQETTDFYRWRARLKQDELRELLRAKLGIDFGAVHKIEAVERGASGRIVRLRVVGERETMVIGKELEIRRALSPSHLYSSAFVVESEGDEGGAPAAFNLIGAGWGHGVGLCQIGAALMAERGYDFRRILEHYYRGARLYGLYSTQAGIIE